MSLPTINLCIIATNRYRSFLPAMLESARQYFCVEFPVTYRAWTDAPFHHPPLAKWCDGRLINHHVEHEPWPGVTLHRYRTILTARQSLLETGDFTFYCDADMRFVKHFGEEILGSIVAVRHPGYVNIRPPQLPYERRPQSLAWVPTTQGFRYYAGGFQGGRTARYLAIADELNTRIAADERTGIVAAWHDESFWNWWLAQPGNHPLDSCLDGRPLELSADYCAGEGCGYSNQRTARLFSLKKDNASLQQ
jgi:hypothetical protein